LAAPNYEGWSCPYGHSRFGAVTEVWGEEQEEWTVGGWVKRIRKSDLGGRILGNRRRRRVERQMQRILAGDSEEFFYYLQDSLAEC
jgi:hypothetical protein